MLTCVSALHATQARSPEPEVPLIGLAGDTGWVRKQYHFRAGGRGLYAWDIDRLLAAVDEAAVEDVPLAQIAELDSTYWFDHGSSPTVRSIVEHCRLMQEVDLGYPIVLDPEGRVMDGMHRVARALLEGRSTIRAQRLRLLPEPDFEDCQPRDLPY
jgi:hypothetical protein